MRSANILSQTLIHLKGAIDLGDEVSQIGGFHIDRQTMEGLRNGRQLVIAGYSSPSERFATGASHGIAYCEPQLCSIVIKPASRLTDAKGGHDRRRLAL